MSNNKPQTFWDQPVGPSPDEDDEDALRQWTHTDNLDIPSLNSNNNDASNLHAIDPLPALLNLLLNSSSILSPARDFWKHKGMPPIKIRSPKKFVPQNDVPKQGARNHRYHSIKPDIKAEETDLSDSTAIHGTEGVSNSRCRTAKASYMYKQSTGLMTEDEQTEEEEVDSLISGKRPILTACTSCRLKKRRCTHIMSKVSNTSSMSTQGRVAHHPKIKSEINPTIKAEFAGRPLKKDGTLYTKIPYDRSKGPSMTPAAVDYRERKVIAQQYRDRLALLLDSDIIDKVDAEGGITPEGRLLKACVRMLERVHAERADSDVHQGNAIKNKVRPATNVNQFDTSLLQQQLVDLKQRMQAVLDEAD